MTPVMYKKKLERVRSASQGQSHYGLCPWFLDNVPLLPPFSEVIHEMNTKLGIDDWIDSTVDR